MIKYLTINKMQFPNLNYIDLLTNKDFLLQTSTNVHCNSLPHPFLHWTTPPVSRSLLILEIDIFHAHAGRSEPA